MADMMKLVRIQSKLNAPKDRHNKFGGYNYRYRSAESILQALKPLLEVEKCALVMSDDVKQVGERFYIVATCTLLDAETGEKIASSTGYARESLQKKGMDEAQITGSASSYSRKYSLNGLFAIDDVKDDDTNESHIERENRAKEALDNEAPDNAIYHLAQWLAENNIDADYFASLMFNVKKFGELKPKNAAFCLKDLNHTYNVFQDRMKKATAQ